MAGLRERKKQQTRQRISDVAIGLFLDRGFDRVTIAEIAEAADVSVNTVYNYFSTKEDLFFDREGAGVERSCRLVQERSPGESAAEALLGEMRRDLLKQTGDAGTIDVYVRSMRCVRESPALLARLFVLQSRITDRLTETLREEAGAAFDDPTPELVAVQLVGVQHAIMRTVSLGSGAGHSPEAIARQALAKLDVFASLLGDTVLDYARRPRDRSQD